MCRGAWPVIPMLPELPRNHHPLHDGNDTYTSNLGQPYARSDSQLVVTMEKAITHTTDIATLTSSTVMSMTTTLAF
jgi:hypothetical protein